MANAGVGADAAPTLTPEQIHALFDVLTHHQSYAEIESFKYPDAVTSYGFPFSRTTQIPRTHLTEGGWRSWAPSPMGSGSNTPRSRSRTRDPSENGEAKDAKEGGEANEDAAVAASKSPVLQTLLTRFAMQLPWLRDLPGEFWSVRAQGLLSKLAEADLSESYDKGTLGLRKTLATGSSTVVEMLGRGVLGGVKKRNSDGQESEDKKEYDLNKAEDLEKAWDDAVQRLVYGDLVADMFAHMTTSDNLETTAPEVEAATRYSIMQ
jgi:hypothetical protein